MIIKKFNPQNLNNVAGGGPKGIFVYYDNTPVSENDKYTDILPGYMIDLRGKDSRDAFKNFANKNCSEDELLHSNDDPRRTVRHLANDIGYTKYAGVSEDFIEKLKNYCKQNNCTFVYGRPQ